jgi:hypothetical protein
MPVRGDFWQEAARFLPGAFLLCLASLTSGGLGALIVVRLLFPKEVPTLWHLLRLVFSNAVGGPA